MKKTVISTVFIALLGLLISSSLPAAGKDRSIKKNYPLTKITNNVHVIFGPNEEVSKQNQGFRNNVIIVTTSKGVVVVDPGSSVYTGEMVVNKVRQLTSKPIIAVFNTHAHGDHWLGNDGIRRHFPKVDIYGHKKMIQEIEISGGQMWITAMNKRSDGAITGTKVVAPNKPVKNGDVIKLGDTTFKIFHTGKAHSPNDIMIQIPEENIVLIGDVLRVKNLSPFMSSFSGNLRALDFAESLDAKIYIPGHGKAGGRELMKEHRAFIHALKAEVKKHFEEGMSDFEMKPRVIKALSKYKEWASFDEGVGRLINLMYLEVEAESFN